MVVIPLSTTSPRDFPLYVPVPSAGPGSQAVVDQIRAVDKDRIGDFRARITEAEMEGVMEAMKRVFDLG